MTREERITEARRKLDAGDFTRQIVDRTPHDLFTDIIRLDCSHQMTDMRLRGAERPFMCQLCAAAWMRAAEGDST